MTLKSIIYDEHEDDLFLNSCAYAKPTDSTKTRHVARE